MLLIPIYPASGLYMQNYTGVVVRGEYDSSTILSSYDWETKESTSDFIQELVNTPPETELLVPENIEIPPETPSSEGTAPVVPEDPKKRLYAVHTVASGDTLSTIAQKYSLPTETIRSMNGIEWNLISIGQKITIPRINGVQYAVQKWDNLSGIANKYGAKLADILLANDLSQNATLKVSQSLLIPNPTKDPTKVTVAATTTATRPTTNTNAASTNTSSKTTTTVAKSDPQTISYGSYSLSLKVEKGCRNFVWWNCTCFVAKYKNVTWRGNAKDWLKNAQKQGVATGNDPKPGAIIVYHGPGFPPAYGHVGIVMEVNDDHMIIKDMNYRALNEVTTRKETFSNPAIIGYIYVD